MVRTKMLNCQREMHLRGSGRSPVCFATILHVGCDVLEDELHEDKEGESEEEKNLNVLCK